MKILGYFWHKFPILISWWIFVIMCDDWRCDYYLIFRGFFSREKLIFTEVMWYVLLQKNSINIYIVCSWWYTVWIFFSVMQNIVIEWNWWDVCVWFIWYWSMLQTIMALLGAANWSGIFPKRTSKEVIIIFVMTVMSNAKMFWFYISETKWLPIY